MTVSFFCSCFYLNFNYHLKGTTQKNIHAFLLDFTTLECYYVYSENRRGGMYLMEKRKYAKRTVLWKVIPGFVIVLLIGCIVYLCAVVKSNTAARMDSMRYRILFDRECTGSEIVKAAEERDYDIIVLTGEQAEEAGEAIAPFVTENCLVVFENMTLEQVQKATGLVEGFSDEKSSSNASIGLMMKGGALRLCGFESKNGIIDRLTNENVADAAADMLSNNK